MFDFLVSRECHNRIYWSTTEIYGRFQAWSHSVKFLQLCLFFIVVSFKLLEVTTTLSQAIFQVVSSGSNRWQNAAFVTRQLEDKIVVSKIRYIRK